MIGNENSKEGQEEVRSRGTLCTKKFVLYLGDLFFFFLIGV